MFQSLKLKLKQITCGRIANNFAHLLCVGDLHKAKDLVEHNLTSLKKESSSFCSCSFVHFALYVPFQFLFIMLQQLVHVVACSAFINTACSKNRTRCPETEANPKIDNAINSNDWEDANSDNL